MSVEYEYVQWNMNMFYRIISFVLLLYFKHATRFNVYSVNTNPRYSLISQKQLCICETGLEEN